MRIKKTKKELLEELNHLDIVNTYGKIIKNSKEDLHAFINNPNDETQIQAYQSLVSLPFLHGDKEKDNIDLVYDFDYYDVHEDRFNEIRDKLKVLADLFMEYYQVFVKEGLEYDKKVLNSIEDIASE